MLLESALVEKVKKYAWQQADHYIHMKADGASVEDYIFFQLGKEKILNPWEKAENPFAVYGEEKMIPFCVKLLSRRSFDLLQNPNCPKGWLYIGDDCSERYVLGQPGKKTLICIGVNPSRAKPLDSDKTTTIVQKNAKNNGYDGWLIVNLYPLRSTNPNGLPKVNSKILEDVNAAIVDTVLERYHSGAIWAAWGAAIEKKPYLSILLKKFGKTWLKYKWICKGPLSVRGHPHHPLRVSNSETFVDFDMKNYLKLWE